MAQLMEQGGPWPTVDELLGRNSPANPGQRIRPQPFFVAKTTQVGGGEDPGQTGRKVFINVLGSSEIDAPGEGWGAGSADGVPPHIERAIRAAAGEKGVDESEFENVRFPLSMAEPREDTDKTGQPCVVIDCIFNIDVVQTSMANQALKHFLTEVAIGWMGEKFKIQGSSEYKFPKMRYKGEAQGPIEHRIRRDPRDLIKEIEQPEQSFGKENCDFGFGFLEGNNNSSKKRATSSSSVKKEKGEKNVSDRDASFGKLEMHVVYCSDQAGSKAVILVDLGQIEYLKREAGSAYDSDTDFSIRIQGLRKVAIDVELRQKTLLQGEVTLALYAKDTGYEAKIDDRSLNQLLKDKYHQQPVVNVNKNNALKPHRGTSTLEIVIPLAGIDSLLEICQRCRPHKLGEIQFASSGLMELD